MRIHTFWAIVILMLLITAHTQAKIVFTSSRDGTAEIYTIKADGNDIQKLTDNEYVERYPVWSPDGKQIAFARDMNTDEDTSQFDIFIMDEDGSNEQNLTPHPARDRSPSWSPDGGRIAFTRSNAQGMDIYVIDLLTGAIEKMTNSKVKNEVAENAAWSPDGKSIVYGQGVPYEDVTLYIMNIKTKIAKPLIKKQSGIMRSYPSWSPDGKYILYHERIIENVAHNLFLNLIFGLKHRLGVINMDGFANPELTIPEEWSPSFNTGWAANSREIVFASALENWGDNDIYHYNLVTHEITNLTNNAAADVDNYDPDWFYRRSLSISAAGKMVTQWGALKK